MLSRRSIRQRGFSLLEMTIAMALGVIVVGAATQMYSRGVQATWSVTQRAEMQQDFRAAANMLTKDVSMAGAGMGNNVQIGLPSGNGVKVPVLGCDQTPKCYINGGAVAYPTQVVNGVTVPYLYGLIPGNKLGPTVNAGAGASDIVTVVNMDTAFLLSCYTVSVTNATTVRFTLTNPLPITCVVPPPLLAPQQVNDPVIGLTPGDIVLFNVTIGNGNGAQSSTVIGEVTAVNAAGNDAKGQPQYDVNFAANDPLLLNQPNAAAGSIGNILNATGQGSRINVITYYIDNSFTPPRLMRQISGHTPVPLVENVSFLQFTYDMYDFNQSKLLVNQDDGGKLAGMTPNQITKVTIKHMALASTLHGTKGFQGLDLQTSVATRDLTFKNDYPISGP